MKSITNTLLALVLVAVCSVGVQASAQEAPPTTSAREPFYVPDVLSVPECKYLNIRKLTLDVTSERKPKMFINVKNIFIIANSVRLGSDVSDRSFESGQLAKLAACVLQTHLTMNTRAVSPIPIYIPRNTDDRYFILEGEESKTSGNLIVFIQAGIMDRLAQEAFDDKIILLTVRYFRSDVNDILSLRHQCSLAFPYADDADALQKRLTSAAQICLEKEYIERPVFD